MVKRIPGETDLAYKYFVLYCEQSQRPRSLKALCEITSVDRKTRTEKVFRRWNHQHNWEERAEEYDYQKYRSELLDLRRKRKKDVESFVELDFVIAKGMQQITAKYLETEMKAIKKGAKPFWKELRQAALVYGEARQWLADLIGFYGEDSEEESEETDTIQEDSIRTDPSTKSEKG